MREDYDAAIKAFEEKLTDLERRQTAGFADEIAGLRRELDVLKAARRADGGVVTDGRTVPVDNGLTRDVGRMGQDLSSGAVLEEKYRPGGPNRGFREPLRPGNRQPTGITRTEPGRPMGGPRMSEMAVGKYVVGILAALLVLMAACVGIGSFWWMLPDGLKFAVVFGGGCLLAIAGEYLVIGRKMRFNGFAQALAGCGFMVSFVGIAAGFAAWNLYGPFGSGMLYIAWFIMCYLCAGQNGSRLFYLLAYLGGYVSFWFGTEVLADSIGAMEVLACVIPVTVVLVGFMDAFRQKEPFLWFLNAMFSGCVALAIKWLDSWYGTGFASQVMGVTMAALCVYCSQKLFAADGGVALAARAFSSLLSCWLLGTCCVVAFGYGAGACSYMALVLFLFVVGGMQPSLALGSAPVTAAHLAFASSLIPVFGLIFPSVVAMIALGAEYGRRGKAENLAVVSFSVLTTYMSIAQTELSGDLVPWTCMVCLVITCAAFAVGYKCRLDADRGRYWCLFLLCACAFLAFYYTGVSGMPEWAQMAALAGWVGCTAVHCAFLEGTGAKPGGVWASFAVLGFCWVMAVPTYGMGLASDLMRVLVLLGVPSFVMATSIKRGMRGLPVQAMLFWCEIGAWAATVLSDYDVPVQAVGLALACASAAAIWAGFRFRRKDIRVAGLALTVTHVLVIAGSTAVGSGTLGIVLSLLGGGAVCFAVSFAYNRISAAYGDDGGDE